MLQGCTDSGICIGIGPIQAYFDGIGIGQVHYTSTNSVVRAILSMKYFFQNYQAKNNDEKIDNDSKFYSIYMYQYWYLYL